MIKTFVDMDCPNPRCGKPIVTELVERAGKKLVHCLHCGGGFNVDESMFVRVFHTEDMFECPHCHKILSVASDHLHEVKPSPNREKPKIA